MVAKIPTLTLFRNNESNFPQLFCQQFKRFSEMSAVMIIQWIEIWRIRWPIVFSNETRPFLLDPVLGKSCCLSRCAILLKDEVVRQEMPAVFD